MKQSSDKNLFVAVVLLLLVLVLNCFTARAATLSSTVTSPAAVTNIVRSLLPAIDVTAYGAKGDGVTDDTAAIQSAVTAAAGHVLRFPGGTFNITNEFRLPSNIRIEMEPATIIKQTASDKNIFKAVQRSNVWIVANGGVLYGKGDWSGSWTGTSGHEDRAIQLLGCTNSGVVGPVIKNCAVAGIAILGGQRIKVANPIIEGTHNYSTPLPSQANFQVGVYIRHDPTYGLADDIQLIGPDISGVAQGILYETEIGMTISNVMVNVVAPNIHDIPGQHAMYCSSGNITITSPTLSNIALSGIKFQSADANLDLRNFTAVGVNGSNIGSHLFEVACIGTGSASGIYLSGNGRFVGDGLSVSGNRVSDLKCDLVLQNVTNCGAIYAGGFHTNHDVRINASTVGDDGILVAATNSTKLVFRPTIREANANSNNAASGISGIRVVSVSANVDLYDPEITDANGLMRYGLYNSTAGSDVKVRGHATFTGAADYAVRTTGTISEFPTEVSLSGTSGKILGLGNIKSSQPITVTAQSTSASNVTIWNQTLDDSSAYEVKIELVGKLSGSAQRKQTTITSLFYRSGGGATIQSASEIAPDASASFAGVYTLGVSSNDAILQVNSGGVATYDWTARVVSIRQL